MNLSMSIIVINEIMVITPLLLNNDDIQPFISFFTKLYYLYVQTYNTVINYVCKQLTTVNVTGPTKIGHICTQIVA